MLMPHKKKRLLVIPSTVGENAMRTEPVGAQDWGISFASDPVSGVAEAVANTPDVVFVLRDPSVSDALAICQKIALYLPRERLPVFVVGENLDAVAKLCHDYRASQEMLVWADEWATVAEPPPAKALMQDESLRQVRYHGLLLDRVRFRAAVREREIPLTATEFNVLWALVAEPGHVKTRQQLVEACRGESCVLGRRTMDQHIRSIRYKLRDWAEMVETVRGVGYRVRELPCCSPP